MEAEDVVIDDALLAVEDERFDIGEQFHHLQKILIVDSKFVKTFRKEKSKRALRHTDYDSTGIDCI